MKKALFVPLVAFLLALVPACGSAQTGSRPVYMQIFFEGPNWLAGHEVLQYAPAFKGKTGELVAEGADTRQLSPGSLLLQAPSQGSRTITTTTVTTEKGTFVTDRNGKTYRQTEEELRKANQLELDNMNKGIKMLEKRSGLARSALTKALNEAAADGWEVVQMTTYGSQGGLVYLLRKQ